MKLLLLIFVFSVIYVLLRLFGVITQSLFYRQITPQKTLKRLYANGFNQGYRGSSTDVQLSEDIKKLYRHYEEALEGDTDFFYHYLRPAMGQSTLLQTLLRCYGDYYQDLFRVIKYWEKQKAVRRIDTWNPGKQDAINFYIEDLIRHLFQQYPVSRPFESVWWVWNWEKTQVFLAQALDDAVLESSKGGLDTAAIMLYFHLTEGGSLREDGLFKSGLVSKKIACHWGLAPAGWRIVPAFWWAVARAEGVSEEKTMALAWTPSSLADLQFWRGFYRLVARENPEELKQCDIHDLAEMIELVKFGKGALAELEQFETFCGIQPDFSVKGRTLKSIERYFDELLGLGYQPVEGLEDRFEIRTNDGEEYVIVRLTNRKELQEEGEVLDHCVGSSEYHDDCRCGYGSIWSLRKREGEEFKPLITIELGDKTILAMSGFANRLPNEMEYQLVDKWSKVNGLKVET